MTEENSIELTCLVCGATANFNTTEEAEAAGWSLGLANHCPKCWQKIADRHNGEPQKQKRETRREYPKHMSAIVGMFGDDPNLMLYRPRLNKITGSTTATILLCQIVYWWKKMGRRAFYKFNGPCNHDRYEEGGSWCEELGFTRWELEGARRRIAEKITKGTSRTEALKHSLIIYWTDNDRKTWYMLNESLLARMLTEIYEEEESEKS